VTELVNSELVNSDPISGRFVESTLFQSKHSDLACHWKTTTKQCSIM